MGFLSMVAQLGININPYVQGLFRARNEAKTFGKDVGKSLQNSLAGAFGTGAIVGFAAKTTESLGALSDMAQRLDTTTQKLQEWNYAATQNGAKAEDVTKFFEAINEAQNNALNGNEEALQSFKRLGVTLKDLQSARTDEIGRKIANAVKSGDIQKLLNDLGDVGGKSGKKLVAAFRSGIDELSAEARDLGQIIPDNTIQKVDQLGDRLAQITTTLMGPMATLLGWVNSAVTKIATTFQLLGAYSTKFSFKKFSFSQTFGDFLNSKEAQDIVAANDAKEAGATPAKEGPRELRKFTPKKQKFDHDLLGKEVSRLNVDSLAAVGGFVGRAATNNAAVDIARKSLKVQEEIAKNTDPNKGGKDVFSYK